MAATTSMASPPAPPRPTYPPHNLKNETWKQKDEGNNEHEGVPCLHTPSGGKVGDNRDKWIGSTRVVDAESVAWVP